MIRAGPFCELFAGLSQASMEISPLLVMASTIFFAGAAEAIAAEPSIAIAPGFQRTARGVSIRRSSGGAALERSRIVVPAPSSKS